MTTVVKPIGAQNGQSNRVIYLDCLRVLAAFGVIMIHVSSQNWTKVDICSRERQIFTIYDFALSWAVPIFVMISGAIFLDNDRPLNIKKLYTKNILRLVTAFFFWSAIYAGRYLLAGYNWWYVSDAFFKGHVHLWYIYLAIGYYMVTPILRQITASKKVTEYFLILSIIMLILVPSVISFLNYYNYRLPFNGLLIERIAYWHERISAEFGGVFLVYFVLGLYLHKYEINGHLRRWIPILALCGYFLKLWVYMRYTFATGMETIPLDFQILHLPLVITVFLFGKDVLSKVEKAPDRIVKWIRLVSDHTFGIYMVHLLVMDKLKDWFGLSTVAFTSVISIPAITVAVMVVSFWASWMLHRIPVLRKYTV